MSEQEKKQEEPTNTTAPSNDSATSGLEARISSEREKRHAIEEEKKILLEKLSAFEKAEQEKAQREALEKGEFQKVISDLEPKAKRWEEYEKQAKTQIESALEKLPESRQGIVKSLMDKGDVITAKSVLDEFNASQPKDVGSAAPGGGSTLTDEEIRAKIKSASPSEYKEMKSQGLIDRVHFGKQ